MKYYVNYLLIFGIALMTFMLSLGIKEKGGGWLFFLGIIFVLCGILVAKNVNQKENEIRQEFNKKLAAFEREYESRKRELQQRLDKMNEIIHSSAPFVLSSTLVADMQTYIYDRLHEELLRKKHPAMVAAMQIKEMKAKTKEHLLECKKIQYRLETLLGIFPELSRYLDEDEAVMALSQYGDMDAFADQRDKVRDYLSAEEYDNLSIDERNQLAFDRYMKRPKSAWQIGIEYEMYIEYKLRQDGYLTIPFGSKMGVNDLGRDIIAQKTTKSKKLTYVIQCKNWSVKKNKEIHENVVCQVFGTSIEYEISSADNETVIPAIISTVPLSDTAKQFADRLGVRCYVVPAGIPPLIKCNINKTGEKIYHLPFDQQYYRTEIKNPGEFYAYSVKEATTKGFRRAMKHFNKA